MKDETSKTAMAGIACIMFLAGCHSDDAGSQLKDLVRPTDSNIAIASSVFDARMIADKVRTGMTEAEVIRTLGQPKEVKSEAGVDSWFYTYEFPDKSGQDKWMILMIEFKKGRTRSQGLWLPNG